MGLYLNCKKPFLLYESEAKKPYFIDKTDFLNSLITFAEQGNNHICITRPRRFGKSVAAAMVGAFFGRGADSRRLFDRLKISESPFYDKHINKHNVIYIDFSSAANTSSSYSEFISAVKADLQIDLRGEYPNVNFRENSTPVLDLTMINEQTGENFIFVFDEWDCVFHKKYFTADCKENYINFIASLTKGTGFVSLTYMTGILPVSKYSSGSSLNNFDEYNMSRNREFSEYFGFTEEETDELYKRYLLNTKEPAVSREELTYWYDGYHTAGGGHIYNPRSVVLALSHNMTGSYWTKTGPYSELSYYIKNDIDGVREDIALMITGESVRAQIDEYSAASMSLNTKDEIFSAMVVYGFLDWEKGRVRIPNKELTDEFAKTVKREKSMGYVNRLAKASDRILDATLEGDSKTVEEILSHIHNTESPVLHYNREAELTLVVTFAYLLARDFYRIEREAKAGRGYADFFFYPLDYKSDGIIIELKANDTPEAAVKQIKEKKYALAFKEKFGGKPWQGKRILAVGISYDSKTGEHRCIIEEI